MGDTPVICDLGSLRQEDSKFEASLGYIMRFYIKKERKEAHCGGPWHIPLIPALGKQRQADFCEFKGTLAYRVSSNTANDTQRNPVSKKSKKFKSKSSLGANPVLGQWQTRIDLTT